MIKERLSLNLFKKNFVDPVNIYIKISWSDGYWSEFSHSEPQTLMFINNFHVYSFKSIQI